MWHIRKIEENSILSNFSNIAWGDYICLSSIGDDIYLQNFRDMFSKQGEIQTPYAYMTVKEDSIGRWWNFTDKKLDYIIMHRRIDVI